MSMEAKVEQARLDAARVAAAWWAKAISGGVRSSSGDGVVDAWRLLAQSAGTPPGKAERFEKALISAIADALRQRPAVHLTTDYGPEGLLFSVAQEILIGGPWPAKTSTCVEPGEVTVRAGYHARSERLLGEPSWTVDSYTPPKDGELCGAFERLYQGKDEAAARNVYGQAAAKLPPQGGTPEDNWDAMRPAVSLRKDGDGVS